MALRIGKCTNYGACGTAYRNLAVSADESAFICPECGNQLTSRVEPQPSPAPWMIAAAGAAVVVLLIALVWVVKMRRLPDPAPAPTPAPVAIQPTPTPPLPEPAPARTATGGEGAQPAGSPTPRSVTPPPTPLPPPAAVAQEREEVRKEVLRRIDGMLNLTPATRTRLYGQVDRARIMNKSFTVPFGSGRANLAGPEEDAVVQQAQDANFRGLVNNPVTVLVILGYADTRGDARRNEQIAQLRARSVLRVLHDKAAVHNMIYTVSMGGSNLLDTDRREKNRVAEVWAVIP